MSIESAKAFMERMNTDKEFAAKIVACKTLEECSQFLSSNGFSFTGDELKVVQDTLSSDELDKVVGGSGIVLACDGNYMDDFDHKCNNNFWLN